ncbi:MAG: DUF402 domain-containing protein [Pyrinomonadaceae bacterium]
MFGAGSQASSGMSVQVTVNSRKYDGSIRRSWKCELIERDNNALVFVGVFDRNVSHPDLGEIAAGTISYEYYWLDRWYNIFCFHEPDGTFRNYYCNINMPPTFADGVLDYVDLDVDVVVLPDGRYEILDEDEYLQNALRFEYPDSVKTNAAAALAEVLELIKTKDLPAPREKVQLNLS